MDTMHLNDWLPGVCGVEADGASEGATGGGTPAPAATQAQPAAPPPAAAAPPPAEKPKEPPAEPKAAEPSLADVLARMDALAEQVAAQAKDLKTSGDRLAKQEADMRHELLARLGVKDKYRSFAPSVDPFSDDGKAKLEKWADDHPELRDAKPAAQADFDPQKVLGEQKNAGLLRSMDEWKRSRALLKESARGL